MLAIKIICGALCVIFAIAVIADKDDKTIFYSANSILFALIYVAATMTNM
jgi:NADH:ubiquinone oxidoreductase subunit 6 (subunit J)